MKLSVPAAIALCLFPLPALAGPEQFHAGSVIPGYGKVAMVADDRLGPDTVFKVAFDISEAGDEGEVNRAIVSAARFLNMHVEAGVPVENISLALVIHGSAIKDLRSEEANGGPNPNADLVAALLEQGVSIQLCGQSAAWYGVGKGDVLPGVSIALSAMTAHALLQQDGYTLNPF